MSIRLSNRPNILNFLNNQISMIILALLLRFDRQLKAPAHAEVPLPVEARTKC
jgi:hypothetical protein